MAFDNTDSAASVCVFFVVTDLQLSHIHHEDALEDLGEISEVEGVVRLGRGGQQLCDDGAVYFNTSLHHGISMFYQRLALNCKQVMSQQR